MFSRSVQFSLSVMSDSLQPHEPQHARSPCPSPTPGVYSDPCPSSQWCHPAISSSVIPSPPALNLSQHQGLFQRIDISYQVAEWSTGVSASTSVLPMNTQDWSPLGWTGWIPLQSKGLLKVFSSTTVQKNTGVGSLPLLQGIFPTQGLNPGLPHDRWILYQLSHKGSPSSMHSVIFTKFTELRNLPHNGVPERFLKYEFLEMFVHGEKILNSS